MKIQSNSNIYFASRTPEIRFADDIVRKVNKEFPRISDTLIDGFTHADKFTRIINRYSAETYSMRIRRRLRFSSFAQEKGLKAIVEPIKDMQRGNCLESAFLSIICAKSNGIKDAKFASLYSPYGYEFDHAVVVVNKDKKPYILDAWLGFADYLPNAVKRWQNEFSRHFDFKNSGTDKIVLKEMPTSQKVFLEELPADIMRKLCPELVIVKRQSV